MDEVAFLTIMALMLVLASVASILFSKLRMPAIIGYLAAGIFIANFWGIPEGESNTVIELLSNIGLVLLMFAIGMELNIKKLKQSGAFTIMVAAIQLPLMVLCGYIAGSVLGWNMVESIFLGAVISGSSTAVVTAVLRANKKISKDTADTVILVTVMEDIGQVIILTMASPLLVGQSPTASGMLGLVLGIVIFMVASIVLGLLVLPRFLNWVSSRFSREIILITALGLCFFLALLSTYVGLSMAIGAFIMGLIASQCKDAHMIERDIEPMKNTFMAIFFIDVGLKIHLGDVGSSLMLAIFIFVVFVISKTITVVIAYFIGNKDFKTSFVSAMSLLAMGEFAFIISKTALDAGAVNNEFYTAVVLAALMSMILMPLFATHSTNAYDFLKKYTPRTVVGGIEKLESKRSDFYSRIVFSTKSAKRVRNRFVVVYVCVLIMAVVEIMFFIYGPQIADLMMSSLGTSLRVSNIIVLSLNLAALLLPTGGVVLSLKVIDRMLIEGGKRKRGYYIEDDSDARSAYSRFIGISNILLVMALDFFIMLIVPNPLPLLDHLAIMITGLVVILFVYLYKYARKS
ncbi:MAG: cation:proton antiporter [Candidatus Methanomethylophilaceae archaeon]|nr:cation:proton antiporter [Candidatus Methanomethylophilaceae archaeon]MDD3986538.1 cation:proton antiporter [Candidatus Methanomethylophilaceae archaeon]